MRRILLLTLAPRACAARHRPASARQTVTFEAPRELLSASTRDADARPDHARSASRACASSSTGATSRRSPSSKTKPALRRERPGRVPRRQVGQPRRADRGRPRSAASSVTLTLTGPVPQWATRDKRDNFTDPDAEGVRRVRDRDRPPLRRRREHVVDLERAQPAAVPQAAVQERQAVLAEALPQALPGGLRGAALDAGQRRGHDPDRRDLAARQLQRRAPARLPARDAVPGLQVPQGEVLQASCDAGGYAHHAYTTSAGPALEAARTTTT